MSLIFSSHPGARERHLQRQYRNPLFTTQQREFDEQRLNGARYMDEKEQEEFTETFHQLVEEVAQLKPNEGSEVMLELKARLDQCYEQCCGLGGQHDAEKQAIAQLVSVIMNAVWQAAQGDAEAEVNLREEELARRSHYHLLQFPVVADLLRPRSPIASDQLIPTLLSESEQAFAAAFSLFDAEQQQNLYPQAKALLEARQQENFDLPAAWQRLEQMHQLMQSNDQD